MFGNQINPEINSLLHIQNYPNHSNNNILNEFPLNNIQENNQNSEKKYITLGKNGVEQTYVSNVQNKEKCKKKRHKKEDNPQSNERNAFINNNINNENYFFINNNYNFRNNENESNSNSNSNNNSNSNHSNDIQASNSLYINNNVIQVPNVNNPNNNLIINNPNNPENISNNSKNIGKINPLFIPLDKQIMLKNENQNQIILREGGINNNINNNHAQTRIILRENNMITNINQISHINFDISSLPQPNKLKNEENFIFSKFKKPALTGLVNLGKTSYLNSVLQLVCNIRPFATYFLNENNGDYFQKNINKCRLSFVLHRLCKHIYPNPQDDNRETYNPKYVMYSLGKHNKVYTDYGEKNPNELIYYLLNELRSELKSYNNYNDNFIYHYFTLIKTKETKCQYCSSEPKYWQEFQTFDLDITEVAKYNRSESIKISNCLEFYYLAKNIKSFCSFCKKYERMTFKNKIYYSPNNFIFLLNLKGNEDINFDIEQEINLNEFILNKISSLIYELNGIVFFDASKNKYNALCLSPIDKTWYLFDDEDVMLFDFDKFLYLHNINKIYRICILSYNNKDKKI